MSSRERLRQIVDALPEERVIAAISALELLDGEVEDIDSATAARLDAAYGDPSPSIPLHEIKRKYGI